MIVTNPTECKPDASLIKNGYEPVAVEGKRALGIGWSTRPNTIQAIAAERAALPNAVSTGLRTGRLIGVDIDVRDPNHVRRIEDLATEILGHTSLRRVGSKGCLLCYRTDQPGPKLTVKTKGGPQIEILGQGQQFVAYGVHPDTGREYEWGFEDPLWVRFDQLPLVTRDKVVEFAQRATDVFAELGYEIRPLSTSRDREQRIGGDPTAQRTGGDPMAPIEEIAAALAKIPNDDLDWDSWNAMLMAVWAATGGSLEGRELFRKWSAQSELHEAGPHKETTEQAWTRIWRSPPDHIGAGYIFMKAYRVGMAAPTIIKAAEAFPAPADAVEQEEEDDGGPRQINTAQAYDDHKVKAQWVSYGDDLGEEDEEPLPELAPRWIEKWVVTFLEGIGGLGKSLIAEQDAACLAAGHDILGVPAEKTGVLYLNYEEREDEFKRRLRRIRKSFGMTKGGDFAALHLKREPAAHILRVTKDGAIIITRFGREFLTTIANRRDRGLHTFVVFDGIMDAILFEGLTRMEDAIARQVIALLERWCEEYDFSAYAILHPSRAAERQGGGSYAPAWSTKPRVVHTFHRVTFDGKRPTENTPPTHIFTRRFVEKRSHGESRYWEDLQYFEGCFERLPVHSAGGGEDPVTVAVDLACRHAQFERIKKDGKAGERKLTNQDAIILEFRRRSGLKAGVERFLATLEDALKEGRINYQAYSNTRSKLTGYYPVEGWQPVDEDGIPYSTDAVYH
jgi:hypothetical protein